MDKKRFFRILTKADSAAVASLAEGIKRRYEAVIIKEPQKTLAMIKLREPVKESLFYIGEVIVCEALVELEGTKGFAVTMGDDFAKVLDMAILDAACNKGVFSEEHILLELERVQIERVEKENALHLKTMVSFSSMDQEVH